MAMAEKLYQDSAGSVVILGCVGLWEGSRL